MILDSGVYRKGVRSALPTDPVSAAKALSEDPECIAWVDLYEPEDDEIALVQQLFSLHELAVEDARTSHQRPKIEQYEDSLVVVLPTAVPVSIRLPLKMS
jgi:magnesium transporter